MHLLLCADVMRYYKEETGAVIVGHRNRVNRNSAKVCAERGASGGGGGAYDDNHGGDRERQQNSASNCQEEIVSGNIHRNGKRKAGSWDEDIGDKGRSAGVQGRDRRGITRTRGELSGDGGNTQLRTKRLRVTDPWEDLLGVVHDQVVRAIGPGARARPTGTPVSVTGR